MRQASGRAARRLARCKKLPTHRSLVRWLPAVARAPLSLWTKYQAFIHLTYYMIYPALLTVVLLSVPLLVAKEVAPAAVS